MSLLRGKLMVKLAASKLNFESVSKSVVNEENEEKCVFSVERPTDSNVEADNQNVMPGINESMEFIMYEVDAGETIDDVIEVIEVEDTIKEVSPVTSIQCDSEAGKKQDVSLAQDINDNEVLDEENESKNEKLDSYPDYDAFGDDVNNENDESDEINKSVKTPKKKIDKAENHPLRQPCTRNCRLKCSDKFTEDRRKEIWQQYWWKSYNDRRQCLFANIRRTPKERSCSSNQASSRKFTFQYSLVDTKGYKQIVCKTFFLATLGYHPKNDSAIGAVMKTTPQGAMYATPDKRGTFDNGKTINRKILKDHIESFNPCVSHHRREHAPNRRYLPTDITIKMMLSDLKEKYKNFKCGYQTYRKVLEEMNISFCKLGEEKCESCAEFEEHKKVHETEDDECELCLTISEHMSKARKARNLYRADVEKTDLPDYAIQSVDMQKVIMLPRMPGFKRVVFTKRIVAFHETFAPIGGLKDVDPTKKNISVVWHEGISGRKAEDIASTFYVVCEKLRDKRHIIFWCDNCSAQNKNWCLYTVLVSIINSDKTDCNDITLRYFEAGHTFMSADSVHAGVEKQIRRKPGGCIYDFKDFIDIISESNGGKMNVIEMSADMFRDFKSEHSQVQLSKPGRPKLCDIVEVKFVRGLKGFHYKTDFDFEFSTFIFLKVNAKLAIPKGRTELRGINVDKKIDIVSKLCPLMPESRRNFWINLEESDTVTDLVTNL